MYPQQTKSAGTAVGLEVVLGIFQVFGVGNIYAGNIGLGLFFMFGYWLLCVVNALLLTIVIGFVTWPLTWLVMMILAPICAARAATRR